MYIQKFYKGIRGLSRGQVEQVFVDGIRSNLFRQNPNVSYVDIVDTLNENDLYRHVTDYRTAGPRSAYVSLTAGTRGIHDSSGFFRPLAAWETALRFATQDNSSGAVFEGWVVVLGTPAWHMVGVAEDIRDHHAYPRFNSYWAQGEVTAKISVPGPQISRATLVTSSMTPTETLTNQAHINPSTFSNLREVI